MQHLLVTKYRKRFTRASSAITKTRRHQVCFASSITAGIFSLLSVPLKWSMCPCRAITSSAVGNREEFAFVFGCRGHSSSAGQTLARSWHSKKASGLMWLSHADASSVQSYYKEFIDRNNSDKKSLLDRNVPKVPIRICDVDHPAFFHHEVSVRYCRQVQPKRSAATESLE